MESNGYTYETVENDPTNARIYTLKNGLKVYLSVNKNAPRIQTFIAVRTGSKNDPAETTGLAHYLEHMLFKGTDKFGTLDYKKESKLIQEIVDLYELHFKTNDAEKRRKIYAKIDSISGIAAKYAIANEYDKLVGGIGAKGTNAYTSLDQTVYVNDIPSNQIENWLEIEAERFRKPVMRLFHTEMEAVYEEKNRSLDNDGSKVFHTLFANLFPTHPYGTQTTIGKIEHLKKPSLVNIQNYFDAYYVPNNMAICLSGDLDPDKTIKMIDEKFSSFERRELPKTKRIYEKPLTAPVEKEVFGPDAENITIGFRLNGATSEDADLLKMFDMILDNSTAGLINLNLNQKQKVLRAYSNPYFFDEYSIQRLGAQPRKGQTLEEAKELLLAQIEHIKKGKFPEWLLQAIVNDLQLDEIRKIETNSKRADLFVDAFIYAESWERRVNQLNRLAKITKQQIVDFANKNFNNNYVVIYKRTGEDKSVQKVEKPKITPISVNRAVKSDFAKAIEAKKTKNIAPVFLDFEKDIQKFSIKSDIPVLYTKNKDNDLFNLYYLTEMGNNTNKKLSLALSYLKYLGTDKYTPSEIQEEFYKAGSSFDVYSSNEKVHVSLSGLKNNLEKGLELFEHLLSNAKANENALENLKKDILKKRKDAKLSKRNILFSALYNYGLYGKNSPFTHILSEEEIKKTSSDELLHIIHNLMSFKHRVLYYGPNSEDELSAILNKHHIVPKTLKELPKAKKFERQEIEKNQVFFVDYNMQQTEIVILARKEKFSNKDVAERRLFNEYFGHGMGSIVFQTIRESKALAYSSFANYQTPSKKDEPHYMFSYIGTQADKLPEAMNGMFELLNEFPEAQVSFENAKTSIIKKIQTERIIQSSKLFAYEEAKELGLDHDNRKDIYEKVSKLSLEDIKNFHKNNIANDKNVILVIGNKNRIDFKALQKYGEVKSLSLEEIFAY
jgi:predicted Zn-dependent peptidase